MACSVMGEFLLATVYQFRECLRGAEIGEIIKEPRVGSPFRGQLGFRNLLCMFQVFSSELTQSSACFLFQATMSHPDA